MKNTTSDLNTELEKTNKVDERMEQAYADLKEPAQEMVDETSRLLLECKYNYELRVDRIVPLVEMLEELELIDIFFEGTSAIIRELVIWKASQLHLHNMVKKIVECRAALKPTKKTSKK